jgi:CMP-N,N'-diacetyllegionaminic acid synthase
METGVVIMNVLGVIIARAGSKGLKNKHLLPLLGRPVIKYTFSHARQSKLLTRVVVSTDSPGIWRLAGANYFETIKRPPELATGDASVQDVMLHAMDAVEQSSAFRADAFVVLYGNVPARGEGVIDRAIRILADTKCDSVRSFCPVGKWHPAWMARLEDDGRAEPLHPGSIHRRQDLPSLFLHDGAVVAVSRASMLRGRDNPMNPHAFFGLDRRGIQTETGETVEIDEQRDLYWAEAVLRDRERIAAGTAVRDQWDESIRMAS